MTSPSPRRDPTADTRYLCSHLVQLHSLGDRSLSQTGLLEEIEATQAWVAVEAAYRVGGHVDLSAEDFQVSAEVVDCRARENDCLLGLQFLLDTVWSPEVWRPDHLYLPPPEQSKAGRKGAPTD